MVTDHKQCYLWIPKPRPEVLWCISGSEKKIFWTYVLLHHRGEHTERGKKNRTPIDAPLAVHGHWPCPYTLLCTAKIRTFFKSKQYEQNFLISKEKATAISILSAVCWLVCAPCCLGQPSILPSSQPHVSNLKISFTAVHGTGLTGLVQCSEDSLQCYFGS